MRKLALCALLLCALAALPACQKQAVTAPIPGQINSFDGYAYRTLMDAQAFLNSIRSQVTYGSLVLSTSQKQAFNAATEAYNTAEASYLTYHAAAGSNPDPTALTQALSALVANLTQLATTTGGK